MALSTQPYKGARDFYPEDKRMQKWLFDTLRDAAEAFGYEEYDAPALEPLELYLAKSGEEIINEQTYAFTDRGERRVAIRPEMTPSVSRMVAARRQELAYPLRWYSIPNLWRYERPQRGRLREHWQLNVDLFGVADTRAEQELITLADHILRRFGAGRSTYEIRLSSRPFIDHMLTGWLGLDAVQAHGVGKLIDRRAKLEPAAFIAQAEALVGPELRRTDLVARLNRVLDTDELAALPKDLRGHETAGQLQAVLDDLREAGIGNVRFDPGLMRGFDYYTGLVFEVFDTDPANNRSMFGGGRYDGLVGLFGVEPVPTAGFGMGDVTLANFLETHGLLPTALTETDVYVILVGDVHRRVRNVLAELREHGIRAAVDLSDRKIGAQIKAAEKKGIGFVLIVGAEELAEQSYSLKNLRTGDEARHGVSRIVSILQDHRRQAP